MGFNPGGSGSGKISTDSDVALNNPANNQVLTYNSTLSKWQNQNVSGASNATSSTPGLIQLAGDVGGTATSPQITSTHLAAALPINQGGTGATSQNFIDLTNAQSVGGVKTFTSSPVVPTPTNTTDAANKTYVDTAVTTADVAVSDEGTQLTSGMSSMNFTGAGVTATNSGSAVTVTISGGGSGSYPATRIMFSTLTGANDDAKMASFISTYSGVTYKPTLELDELRAYTFTTQQQVFSGFHLIGGGIVPLDQNRGSNVLPQVVKLRMGSGSKGWLTLPNGTVFGMALESLSFDADVHSRVFDLNTGCVIWTSTFRDISFQNGLSVIGTSASPQPMDACVFDGFWNVSNVQDTGFNMSGSDNNFTPTIMLLDTTTALLGVTGVMTYLTNMSKTSFAGWYVTCDQHSGFIISGSNQMMQMYNCQIEGRNINTPCYGALIRISSDMTIRDCWTSFAMSSPSSNGRNDLGVIHITSGNVVIDGCFYRPANGVAQSVAYIYVGGGTVRVSNIMGNDGSGVYFKPVVRWLGGSLVTDDSVTVVTT